MTSPDPIQELRRAKKNKTTGTLRTQPRGRYLNAWGSAAEEEDKLYRAAGLLRSSW